MGLSDKRGLSEVVATVLILLLVLVSIGVIWSVVNPTIKKTTGQIGTDCFTINLQATSCSYNHRTNVFNVTVTRGSGAGQLKEIRFLVKDSLGQVRSSVNTSVSGLGELDTVKFVQNLIQAGGDPTSVNVAAVTDSMVCNPLSQEITCQNLSTAVGPI